MKIRTNTVAKGGHVPEIDQINRTTKEILQATYNYIKSHFSKLAGVLIREMVYVTVFWINSFPSASGISTTTRPKYMLTGIKATLLSPLLT